MSLIGNIGPYEESENISTYIDRVKLYFAANEINQEKQVPAFLSIMGPKLYGLLKDLVNPKNPKDCSFDALVKAVTDHYKPQVVVIYERFKFYSRKQEVNENVTSFLAGLKSLAATCSFGDKLEEALRDRIVMGLKDEGTQHALLTEKDLTFERAVEISIAREAAARDVSEFGQNSNSNRHSRDDVHTVKAKNYPSANDKRSGSKSKSQKGGKSKGKEKPRKPFSSCGASHWKAACPFLNAECHSCKRTGHIAKVCFNKDKQRPVKSSSDTKNVGSIESSNTVGKSSEDFSHEYIFSTSSSSSKSPYYVTLEVAGSKMDFQVDTGAARTLMSYKDYKLAFSEARPKIIPSHTELRRYGGSQIQVCGEICVKIKFRDRFLEKCAILIVKDDGPSLLGRDLLPELQIGLNFAENCIYKIEVNSLISKFPKLFEDKLGTYKDLEVSLELDSTKTAFL